MTEYITCDLLGPGDGTANYGLCNQMFQVASLMSFARDNNLNITFPQIKNPFFGNYTETIFRKVPAYDIDTTGYRRLEVKYAYQPNLPKHGGITYRGYFQSEKYFKHNRDFILDLFEPPQEVLTYLKSKYSKVIESDTISIHIRRGDYLRYPNHHPLLSPAYYIEAINYILSKSTAGAYAIFSDDVEWCKKVFGSSEEITYIEREADYVDLYLMSLCKHNIIANSTFSWWGAWLGQHPEKIVVAPNQWFGPAITDKPTDDLLPETWHKLQIDI